MKYRKKPVIIEAWKINVDDHNRQAWVMDAFVNSNIWWHDGAGQVLAVETLEGMMLGRTGDFLIKGVKGELYPCKPDIFEMTYEVAE
jgi:hypothetical protein